MAVDLTNFGLTIEQPLFEGQIYSAKRFDADSLANSLGAVFPFGRVIVETTEGQAALPSATGQNVVGIHGATFVNEQIKDSNGDSGVPSNQPVTNVSRGQVSVYFEEAVGVGDPVFFRHTAGGGGSIVGRFRNDADTATCDQISAARVVVGTTAAGLGVIEINLP